MIKVNNIKKAKASTSTWKMRRAREKEQIFVETSKFECCIYLCVSTLYCLCFVQWLAVLCGCKPVSRNVRGGGAFLCYFIFILYVWIYLCILLGSHNSCYISSFYASATPLRILGWMRSILSTMPATSLSIFFHLLFLFLPFTVAVNHFWD